MASKKEHVPFSGTPEQEAALKKVITELKDTKGALMPIMQQAQDIYGYLPIEVQTMISDETGIPLEKIYGVSTFYSQFAFSVTKILIPLLMTLLTEIAFFITWKGKFYTHNSLFS